MSKEIVYLLVWLGLISDLKKPAFSLSQEEAEEGQGQTRASLSLATNRGHMEMTGMPLNKAESNWEKAVKIKYINSLTTNYQALTCW